MGRQAKFKLLCKKNELLKYKENISCGVILQKEQEEEKPQVVRIWR